MVFGGKDSENREKNKIKSNLFFIPKCSTLRLSAMMGVTNVVKSPHHTHQGCYCNVELSNWVSCKIIPHFL